MADDEDDYLSDKFLFESAPAPSPSAPKTYAERRKEAQRLAAIKNEQNRKKSKRQLEQEAREEGLSKSLFERAKDEEATGQRNKALAMMMKMGYKPGESLGQKYDDPQPAESSSAGRKSAAEEEDEPADAPTATKRPRGGIGHIVEPLPLNEWVGKTGIGLRKRAASPSASERLAKMAKLAEEVDHSSFRDRARQEYEERQAQGRLAPAQRTCINLDEKDGRKFNILWLNPENPDTFPEGLIEDLDDPDLVASLSRQQAGDTIEGRLRVKMRADALQPLTSTLEDDEAQPEEAGLRRSPYSEEEIQEARQFLRLSAKHRLQLVLDYLRQRYAYCFWCGTEYDNQEDMDQNCPGPEEEAHD